MLASRLRGSRSIRARYCAPSYRAHVAQANIVGRGRPVATSRSYATELNKPDDDVSNDAAESEHLFNQKVKSESLPEKGPEEEAPKEKNGTKSSKSTSTSSKKKKKGGADAPIGAKEAEPGLNSESKAKSMRILREATLLLREFQANPAKFADKKKSGGAAQGGDSKRSLKTQFTPITGAPKYDERQTKIFYETLSVLGDALKIVVEDTPGKDSQADKHIAAAKEAIAGISVDPSQANDSAKSEKKTAETTQKQSPKKKAEKEPELDKKAQEQQKKKGNPQQKPEPQDSTKKKKKKGETQQKSESQESTKKKASSHQESERKETNDAPLATSSKKTKAKKAVQSLTRDAVSKKLAAVVASARSSSRTRKNASKSRTEDKAKHASEDSKTNKHGIKVENFRADPASALKAIEVDMKPVPLIQYGLDRVLFKDGVYALQDPRTRVWNFDPYLATIMPVTDFDFDALAAYITSSKDQKLIKITKDQKKKYTGSTSSMTSTLAHFHFLLSQWRPINCARLSQQFDLDFEGFSATMKSPAATILNYKDGVYAIDADKEWDSETVLSMLGKSMEKLLTVPKDEFVKYHRSKSHELTEEEKGQEESYHYSTYGDFLMRSQLDAYDPRLPGTGVYDLKTRAVVSVRMDARNVHKGVGYEIRQRDGNWESFEREYFDMIRSAFLKYSLQVRMGRMDGIFVAYHNTERIFGFQYVPLEEMDLSIHGTTDMTLGDREFTASLKLFNEMLDQATAKFPEQSLRIHVETRTSDTVPFLYFFAEPVTDEQIKNIQEKSKGTVEKFKARLGIPLANKANAAPDSTIEETSDVEDAVEAEENATEEAREVVSEEEDSDQVWQDMMDVVEDTMDKDAEGITAIREAIQAALEQSGLLRAKSSEEAQHYVEALLRAIVDTDAELAKSESHDEENDDVVQQSTEAEPTEPSPEPKQSGLSSFFNWLRPSSPEVEVPAEKPNQENVPPEDMAETKDTTKKTENVPSPELVELLVKLASRVGMRNRAANEKTKEQELSDDQARLRSFETILLDMMPDVLEPAEEVDEKDAPAVESGDSSAAEKPRETKTEKDPLFAMYMTVRNKVNNEPVERPENLKSSDKWDIEYAMGELHGERAAKLYQSCKKRRKTLLAPRDTNFNTLFDGQLTRYIELGRTFRKKEKLATETQPVWIVGQPAPVPASEVFTGAGAKLEHVLPSVKHGRPGEKETKSTSQPKPVGQEATGDSKEVAADKKDLVADKKSADKGSIPKAVAELRKGEEEKASSFKEWREKSKQSWTS